MENTLAWVIGGALIVLAVFGAIMGRRLVQGRIRLGKHFAASVDGKQEARVTDAQAFGSDISVTASGPGSVVEKTFSLGNRINIGASTSPPPPTHKPH